MSRCRRQRIFAPKAQFEDYEDVDFGLRGNSTRDRIERPLNPIEIIHTARVFIPRESLVLSTGRANGKEKELEREGGGIKKREKMKEEREERFL